MEIWEYSDDEREEEEFRRISRTQRKDKSILTKCDLKEIFVTLLGSMSTFLNNGLTKSKFRWIGLRC